MANHPLADRAGEILNVTFTRLGRGRGWAYYAEETREWYRVSRDDLQYAVTLARDNDPQITGDIYSHWCSGTGTPMSAREVAANGLR